MKSDKVESWVLPYAHNVDIPITVNPQSVEQHLQTLKELEEQHSIRMNQYLTSFIK